MARSESDNHVGSGRPRYHLAAPAGWLNDPCAPGYDPVTGLYHLFYQWDPHSHRWGEISWGNATSRDLVKWTHSSDTKPVLRPDQPYDKEGIFTGCFFPTGAQGESDQLSVFYTSVNHLPISWDQPYTRGCEGLALATSSDGGQTWRKHSGNPILSEEPPNMHVTGFRDPYLAPWPAMDKARGSGPTLYGLISGGIHSHGPRTFLYAVSPADLTKWTYLYPLVIDIPPNHTPAGRWGGDFGANWECTNFLTLEGVDGSKREMVFAGAEGGVEQSGTAKYHQVHSGRPRRIPRYANWFFGQLGTSGSETRLDIGAAGLLDWGLFYAANHFVAQDGRKVLWGWLIEEDLTDKSLSHRGWTGCMGVPRELFLQTLDNVTGALRSDLASVKSVDLENVGGNSRVTTLGIKPLSELHRLRDSPIALPTCTRLENAQVLTQAAPLACELRAVFEVRDDTRSVSLVVRHDNVRSCQTVITFDCTRELLTVDRHASTTREDINTSAEVGPFTLFRQIDPATGMISIEKLDLTVMLDHDVVEVFANDRFGLATRVYTDSEHTGITICSDGAAQVEQLSIWPLDTCLSY